MAGASQPIDIQIDDAELKAALKKLAARLEDLTPVFRDIGEQLLNSTRARFDSSTAPDGTPWKALGPAALAARARRAMGGGSPFYKSGQNAGRYKKKAALAVAFAKPLVLTGNLRGLLNVQASKDELRIGTPLIYGATHQFGREEANIPARPFLGLSDQDRRDILEALAEWLAER